MITAPAPEFTVRPVVPAPPIVKVLAAEPSEIVVVPVLPIVMLLIDAGVPLRLALAVVEPPKLAVSEERGGVSVPFQLPAELQLPVVPPFQVEVDAGEVAQAAKNIPAVRRDLRRTRLKDNEEWEAGRVLLGIEFKGQRLEFSRRIIS